MPSQLMDSPDQTKIGFWKTDGEQLLQFHACVKDGNAYAVGDNSLPLEKQMSSDSHMLKHFNVPPNQYLNQDHNVQISLLENNTVGRRPLDHKSHLTTMGDHYENGLFSSSLSDIFSRKLRLSANNNSMYGHSLGASHYEEEPFESLQEIEAQTIGNLLPDDDDLLSGVTDGLDCKVQPGGSGDDVEELDFFSSVGGMELGEDGGGGQRNYEISATHGEHPSRTLCVRNINGNADDSELRILFEDNRLLDKDINQGTVMIYNLDSTVSNEELRHVFGVYGEVKEIRDTPIGSRHKSIEFYDIRAAETALRELNKSDMGGKQMKLVPSFAGASKLMSSPFPELDFDENSGLMQMCSPPTDFTRNISGLVPNVIRSGDKDRGSLLGATATTGGHVVIPASVSNSFSSIIGVESGGMLSSLRNPLKYDFRSAPNHHPHSLPEYQDGLTNSIQCNSPSSMAASLNGRMSERVGGRQFNRIGGSVRCEPNDSVFGPSANAICSPATHHYMWNPCHQQPQPHNTIWPNSPSLMNGVGNAPRAPSHMPNSFLHINHHQVGSAPSVNPSIWDRRHSYAGESPDTSVFHPGSLGNVRVPGNSPHPLDFVCHNMFPRMGGNSMDFPKNTGLASHHQNNVIFPSRGQMIPVMSSFDSPSDRARNRRNEGNSSQADNKKQFELDLDRIMRGEDRRTTLMIKNIPNKYTSKMLLAAIDERHRGTYDFIYLPIDFKNKCNVGYAFINMTEPPLIIPFYEAFNGKKWEKFNSEKVASLAYARIQGKAALIAHFQNSSLMNEDKRCRPILFHTDGPNAGDQVPFPMGVNVRSRVNKNRNSSTNVEDVEGSSSSSSGSTKDFE